VLVIEDSAASYAKKKVQITNLPGGADADAIHDNVAAEINAITEKTSPVGADVLVIEDSAASYAKKKVQITNLPGGSGGLETKCGAVALDQFTDNAYAVTFTTSMVCGTGYRVTFGMESNGYWTPFSYTSKLASGFTIQKHSDLSLSSSYCTWTATEEGES
jgi:hypothetical protein